MVRVLSIGMELCNLKRQLCIMLSDKKLGYFIHLAINNPQGDNYSTILPKALEKFSMSWDRSRSYFQGGLELNQTPGSGEPNTASGALISKVTREHNRQSTPGHSEFPLSFSLPVFLFLFLFFTMTSSLNAQICNSWTISSSLLTLSTKTS